MHALNVTPDVAQNTTGRRAAIDGRTARHFGYETSQQKRKQVGLWHITSFAALQHCCSYHGMRRR
jgi:hypothetical protein